MSDHKVLIATIERNKPDISVDTYEAEVPQVFDIVDDLKPHCDSGGTRCQDVEFTMWSLTTVGTALFSSIEQDA